MKKNCTNKKIKILYMLMFFTSLLLTTTTYAWFTTTKVVSIETFNIHIASDGGLQISSDGINWKSILEVSDLYDASETYVNNVNQLPLNFEPVSTAGLIENGKMIMYSGGVINSNNKLVLVSSKLTEKRANENDADAKFIAFDIFIKTESNKDLYLSSNSQVENISDNPTGIENAFRIAFLNQGNVDVDTDVYTIQNLNGGTKAYIWEPNYDTHTSMAVQNAFNMYGLVLKNDNESVIPYYGVFNEIKESNNVLIKDTYTDMYPNFFRKVNVDLSTRKGFDDNKYMFGIEPGITKFRVYIWLEGQDVDCEDNASLGDVAVNLQITTLQ